MDADPFASPVLGTTSLSLAAYALSMFPTPLANESKPNPLPTLVNSPEGPEAVDG